MTRYSAENNLVELGNNLRTLGDVMAQLEDTLRAREYYDRAATCFKKVYASKELYKNEMCRTNTMNRNEGFQVFKRLLADTVVTNSPELHIMALKGAYLSGDSVAYLDSCLREIQRYPKEGSKDYAVLLAMRAYDYYFADSIGRAHEMLPQIKKAEKSTKPIAQHREYIHVAMAHMYHEAGMKDSCIKELQQVVWWADSAYREANLPAVYAHETRNMIDIAENNARLEKRSMLLWWAVSVSSLLTVMVWVYFHTKRQREKSRQEIELLDNRMECLRQMQTAQTTVMEENRRLMEDIGNAVARNQNNPASDSNLAVEIRRILSLYDSYEDNRQSFLEVNRKVDPRFYTRLKDDFPKLSEGQLRLAALIAAGVDSGQLAGILNVSGKSLYTSRYRLRTSLGLSKKDSLEDFLRKYK
ncbi:MAG: hypothetical protein NC204_07270 [Candidatus Amulumruptor caecigallinarius]|nr:hypothetical protein [Candidatus Amulumruptor caecigallinarius]